jgi:uncharacterized membrane protein YozB (DUF420 family)
MTVAPLSSTIVALALIPVAFLFCHAFLSGRRKNRFHAVSGAAAITWDLSVSIGYMMYRTFGGAVNGETLQMTPLMNTYFMVVHVPIAVVVMSLELVVLSIGLFQLHKKAPNKWHGKLAKILFVVWWFAFLSGEILYIILYMI